MMKYGKKLSLVRSRVTALEDMLSKNKIGPKLLKRVIQLENLDRHRNISCSFYESCLDYAGWSEALTPRIRSFTCQKCKLFKVKVAHAKQASLNS